MDAKVWTWCKRLYRSCQIDLYSVLGMTITYISSERQPLSYINRERIPILPMSDEMIPNTFASLAKFSKCNFSLPNAFSTILLTLIHFPAFINNQRPTKFWNDLFPQNLLLQIFVPFQKRPLIEDIANHPWISIPLILMENKKSTTCAVQWHLCAFMHNAYCMCTLISMHSWQYVLMALMPSSLVMYNCIVI